MNVHRSLAWFLVLAGMVAAAPRWAHAADESAYYKACYLQSDQRDFAAAATLFEQAAGDSAAPADIQRATQAVADALAATVADVSDPEAG